MFSRTYTEDWADRNFSENELLKAVAEGAAVGARSSGDLIQQSGPKHASEPSENRGLFYGAPAG